MFHKQPSRSQDPRLQFALVELVAKSTVLYSGYSRQKLLTKQHVAIQKVNYQISSHLSLTIQFSKSQRENNLIYSAE